MEDLIKPQKPKIPKKNFIISFFLLLLLAGIPLTLSQIHNQQNLLSKAWSTTHSASAACSSSGIVIINVAFINNESNRDMIVTATDSQSGKSLNLGTIKASQSKNGTIDTGLTNAKSGIITFNLAWADSPGTKDTANSSYSSVDKCPAPSPSQTPNPSTNPSIAPSSIPSPSIGPSSIPNTSPTISDCPTPGTVKNIHIVCPYCTPSPIP